MWQPIETAPKDETEILAARQFPNGYWERIAVYFSDGKWNSAEREERVERQEVPFTHWMELPPNPEAP